VFCGRPAPKIPRPLLRLIALAGDAITAVRGKQFYLTSSRYRSMTSDYPTPMDKTFKVIGKGPFSLEQGIDETVKWLRTQRLKTQQGSSTATHAHK
jgi:GlcNAc-P-P-Und epimerase